MQRVSEIINPQQPIRRPVGDVRDGIKKQIERLKGYGGYEELRIGLARVLQAKAASDEHAERIVTSIIETRMPGERGYLSCPGPAEMIAYVSATPITAPPSMRPPDKSCACCAGTGFAIIERNGYSAAQPCECRGTE
jgi:hypothetical protein